MLPKLCDIFWKISDDKENYASLPFYKNSDGRQDNSVHCKSLNAFAQTGLDLRIDELRSNLLAQAYGQVGSNRDLYPKGAGKSIPEKRKIGVGGHWEHPVEMGKLAER